MKSLRTLSHELWPLKGRLRHMRVSTLQSIFEEADPTGGKLYSGLPMPIVQEGGAPVHSLLVAAFHDPEDATKVGPEVERALDADGIWVGKEVAIYRRRGLA